MITAVIAIGGLAAAALAYATARSPHVADPVEPVSEQAAVSQAIRRRPRLREFFAQRTDRSSAGGLLLTVAFAVLFVTALTVGQLLDMVRGSRGLARWDASIARWGAEHSDATSETVVKVVTQFGARPTVLAVLAVAAVVDWRRRGSREVFAFVAVVGLGEMLLSNVIKVLVERERPDIFQVVSAHGWSFPSGHSSAAAAAWAAVALVVGRDMRRRQRAALGAAAALIAVAVATSRALLGVHWFTDVLAGLALGWGWFTLVAVAFGGRRQRLGTPVEEAVPEMPAHERSLR